MTISRGGYRVIPIGVDATAPKPRGYVFPPDNALQLGRNFVVSKKLLLEVSGYVLSTHDERAADLAAESPRREGGVSRKKGI